MNVVMSKMRDIMKFAQAAIINVQQEQKCQINHHYQKSPQLYINDKIWLAIEKQYSTERFNQKLNYKNQKYTVTKVVSSYVVHFNIKDIYSVFYVD